MKPVFNSNTILIAILIIVFFSDRCDRQKQGTKATSPDIIRTEITIHKDSVIHEVLSSYIYYSDTGKLILPEKPDTNYAVKDYYTEHPFTDSLSNDTITVAYSGIIWKGSMFNSKLHYLWKLPQTTISSTVLESPAPRFKAYLGAYGMLMGTPAFGGLFSIQNRYDDIFTIGYGYPQNVILQAQFKIKFRRNEGHPP